MHRSQYRSKRHTTILLRKDSTSTVLCKVPLINISISAITCYIAIAIIIFQRRKKIINSRIRYFLFRLVAIDLIYSSFIILIIMISIAQSTTSNNIQRPKRTDSIQRRRMRRRDCQSMSLTPYIFHISYFHISYHISAVKLRHLSN